MRCKFLRIGDPEDLAREVAVKGANFRDGAVPRQVLKENDPVWQDHAVPKVFLLELGSGVYQAFAPERPFFVLFVQLNAIPEFPRHPGTERTHYPKPLGPKLVKPAFTLCNGRVHRNCVSCIGRCRADEGIDGAVRVPRRNCATNRRNAS